MILLPNFKKIRSPIENVSVILRATPSKLAYEFHTIMIGGKNLSEAFFIISFHYVIISEKTANYFREL